VSLGNEVVNYGGEVLLEMDDCNGNERRCWEVKVCVEDTAEICLVSVKGDGDWVEKARV
jgi:hypothetical protein